MCGSMGLPRSAVLYDTVIGAMMFVRRIITTAVTVVMVVSGLCFSTSTPANAATTYSYSVYHYQVCQRQGHFGASFLNPWNPYSWYCYDISFPLGVTWAGSLDINGWCRARYAGTHVELWSGDVWGWRCVRRT